MSDQTDHQPAGDAAVSLSGTAVATGASSLKWFLSKCWWRNAGRTTFIFARYCVFPAILFTVAMEIAVGSGWFISAQLGANQVMSAQRLLVTCIVALASLVGTCVFLLWSLGVWLLRVTAYTRSCLALDLSDPELSRSAIDESHQAALRFVLDHRAFLAKFWLFLTLLLLAPFGLLLILMSIEAVSVSQNPAMKLFELPAAVNAAIIGSIAFLTILLTQISLIGLAVSAWTARTPFDAVKHSFVLFIGEFLPSLIVTLFVASLAVVLSSPQVLLKLNDVGALFAPHSNPVELLIENAWQGLTSVVLWTFVMVPICELLRTRITREESRQNV